MAAKIIAFANQKGGVGKTTSCVNVAAGLVAAKKKVLLIDLDPQGNATMGSGVNKLELVDTINEVLLGSADIADVVFKATPAGYDLLPANGDLTSAEIALLKKEPREQTLAKELTAIADDYDYIVLDCPPSLNMLTLNALVASHSVIIPMQCEYYALEGLSALLSTMEQVKSNLNPALEVEGIIRTMYDPRNRLATDVSAQLKKHFKAKVYKTIIPRNVRLAEAPSHGLPVMLYDKNSRGSAAYLALAGEIVRANNNKQRSMKREVLEAIDA